jgi:hypothetical protein
MTFKSAAILVGLLLVNTLYASSDGRGQSRNALIGKWSTAHYFGRLVNPGTGAPVQSLHSGQWFDFNADGTYSYLHIASGQLISGAIVEQGTYELYGERLLLHAKKTSFYPSPGDPSGRKMSKDRAISEETILNVKFEGATKIRVWEGDTRPDVFTRDPNSK